MEFSSHHQKNIQSQQHQIEMQHQTKPEFHHIKSDYHHMKNDFSHKLHDFHSKQPSHNFHQNQVGYYNHQPDGNPANSQYANQYYHNEYDAAAIDQAGYYDAKTQTHYYENMNYHPATGDYQQHEAYMTPPSSLQTDSCDNLNFSHYYEGQVVGSNGHVHAASSHNLTNPAPTTVHNQVHVQAAPVQGFIHGPQTQYQQSVNTITHPAIPNVVNMENSNSSSDFNFLSNLANDFAPEYYQLS